MDLARLFVGLKEEGTNDGPLIREFQRAVDGKAENEAYCVAFIQWCLRQVDDEIREDKPTWPGHVLYKTENSILLWNMTRRMCRLINPEPGCVVLWQHYKTIEKDSHSMAVPLSRGHAGIVVNVINREVVETIEANTSAPQDGKIVREGDGIFLKRRALDADSGSMRFLGFLGPWSV